MDKRTQILAALAAHVAQRAGIDPNNYNDYKSYRAEARSVMQDRHDFDKLLKAVQWHSRIGEAELREAFRAYSGRLSLVDRADGTIALDYCTGQYFPTEYRKAACAVLASALWVAKRGDIEADRVLQSNESGIGTRMRLDFKREFGRRIQQRYFD